MATEPQRTRLDIRAQLARDLATASGQLGAISLESPLAEFASAEDLVRFRALVHRARREIQAAELMVHDLVLGVQVTYPVRERVPS